MEKSMDFNEQIAILYKMRFLENEGMILKFLRVFSMN